jgi:hypothetical protein
MIKAMYDKSTANSVLNGEKTEIISNKVGMKQGCLLSPTLIQYSTGIPGQNSMVRERNKRDSNREERSKIIPTY